MKPPQVITTIFTPGENQTNPTLLRTFQIPPVRSRRVGIPAKKTSIFQPDSKSTSDFERAKSSKKKMDLWSIFDNTFHVVYSHLLWVWGACYDRGFWPMGQGGPTGGEGAGIRTRLSPPFPGCTKLHGNKSLRFVSCAFFLGRFFSDRPFWDRFFLLARLDIVVISQD